ncbi:glycosyltransferase [Empedobacter falsenii]|uniref:Glycosyltransferase n=1 Tax=Empedobacter falsenii TaxID=343874 RepID=A0ABY8V537_9FLAO|nr:glycosyltransferase [Empedobacter falsenii]WIH96292.1 glycosyltransferase [Empedobacter falsenii]
MKKISIIIPVYNGENNILNCYESINNQTIESLEIIFINDGSTDKSLDIIKEIKLKDDRVIIIDQKNQGVSSARNNGIKVATSEYIGFIDVDDIIYPEYYSKLLSNINNNEIIISNILLEKDNVLKQKTSFLTTIKSMIKKISMKKLFQDYCV